MYIELFTYTKFLPSLVTQGIPQFCSKVENSSEDTSGGWKSVGKENKIKTRKEFEI